MSKSLPLSLIVPTFNEERNIPNLIKNIKLLNAKELIVVDGNSTDKTRHLLKESKVFKTRKSRGHQLHLGALKSNQDWFFFMHADTLLNPENIAEIRIFLKNKNKDKVAYFRLRFDKKSIFSHIISGWANLRTKLFKLPFGDQCFLISKSHYNRIGGYSEIPIMEDIDMILKISKKNKYFFKSYVTTSFKRYSSNGALKQSLKNIYSQIRFLINAK